MQSDLESCYLNNGTQRKDEQVHVLFVQVKRRHGVRHRVRGHVHGIGGRHLHHVFRVDLDGVVPLRGCCQAWWWLLLLSSGSPICDESLSVLFSVSSCQREENCHCYRFGRFLRRTTRLAEELLRYRVRRQGNRYYTRCQPSFSLEAEPLSS